MPYEFCRLTETDIALMRELNDVFAIAFEDHEAYRGAIPEDEYLRSFLADKKNIALVAMQDGVIAGGLVAYELTKFERNRSEVYIYDLAVLEEHRRKGVATGLIEALKPIAKSQNAWVIYVQADPPDAPAVALYDKLGLREEVYHFDILP